MNYRHAFHAGNFADVLKHAVLCRILLHFCAKPAAFRVIDTHAGAGLYDLMGPEAERSAEWQDGIGRLLDATLAPAAEPLFTPYFDAVRRFNPDGRLATYPGSPALAQALLRPQDRLTVCELEPGAATALKHHTHHDPRVKLLRSDGWTALKAELPPPERRGLVLVDPPFEKPDEFATLAEEFVRAHRKWATGSYALWYPIKDRRGPDALASALRGSAIPKILRAELTVASSRATTRLRSTGLILINPPWTIAGELAIMLPVLAAVLAHDGGGEHRLDWLAGEK